MTDYLTRIAERTQRTGDVAPLPVQRFDDTWGSFGRTLPDSGKAGEEGSVQSDLATDQGAVPDLRLADRHSATQSGDNDVTAAREVASVAHGRDGHEHGTFGTTVPLGDESRPSHSSAKDAHLPKRPVGGVEESRVSKAQRPGEERFVADQPRQNNDDRDPNSQIQTVDPFIPPFAIPIAHGHARNTSASGPSSGINPSRAARDVAAAGNDVVEQLSNRISRVAAANQTPPEAPLQSASHVVAADRGQTIAVRSGRVIGSPALAAGAQAPPRPRIVEATHLEQPTETTVQITIGRVEVRAEVDRGRQHPSRDDRRPTPSRTLDDYLRGAPPRRSS